MKENEEKSSSGQERPKRGFWEEENTNTREEANGDYSQARGKSFNDKIEGSNTRNTEIL